MRRELDNLKLSEDPEKQDNLESPEIDMEVLKKLNEEEELRKIEAEKRAKKEERVDEIKNEAIFFNIKLSDRDLVTLEAETEDNFTISKYLEKYLLPIIPKLYEESKTDPNRFKKLVHLAYRENFQSKYWMKYGQYCRKKMPCTMQPAMQWYSSSRCDFTG